MNAMQYAQEFLAVPAAAGATAYVAEKFLLKSQGSVTLPVVGRVDSPMASAATVFLSAGISNAAKNTVIDYIPGSFSRATVRKAVGPVTCGALNMGVKKYVASQSPVANRSALTDFGVGAGSYLVAEYALGKN